jgi:putative tryptophan/tyrosine transport system substrate-binding protein
MRRRKFIALLGGAAVAWPLATRAQQSGQMRRIGALMPFARDDPEAQARITVFVQELQKLGWTEGRNLQIEYRWDTRDPQKAAAELVALSPDVIFTIATPAVAALQQATRNVPIAGGATPTAGGLFAPFLGH